jgi:hypothetical protein
MVVSRNRHSVAKPGLTQRRIQGFGLFVAGWVEIK